MGPRLPHNPVASYFLVHTELTFESLEAWGQGVIKWKGKLYSRLVCTSGLVTSGPFGVSYEQLLWSVPGVIAPL